MWHLGVSEISQVRIKESGNEKKTKKSKKSKKPDSRPSLTVAQLNDARDERIEKFVL